MAPSPAVTDGSVVGKIQAEMADFAASAGSADERKASSENLVANP
jgi:hypothetical protein